MAYGKFLGTVIIFFSLGVALYFLASLYQWGSKDPVLKHTATCRYCRKYISEKAKRCVNCTSWVDRRPQYVRCCNFGCSVRHWLALRSSPSWGIET
ncbi:hypothetical protein F5Y16DRAFT_381799 [Xylariaceae sp. FL0255]|nr:hypothetical protein F5Y16DRAFT_381799 [Xylariaceae sp. FL0255]